MAIDPGVKLLQEELGKLAQASGNVDCSPGRSDGTMNLGTIVALSHAAGVLGNSINAALGQAVDVIELIKKPLAKIPYAGAVIDLILSPWIIDSAFDSIIAIVKIIPGAGDAAETVKKAVQAFELLMATAASSLAAALALARQSGAVKPQGLGDAGRAWWTTRTRGPEFYNPAIHGPLLSCGLGDAPPVNTNMQYVAAAITPPKLVTTGTKPVIQVGTPGGSTVPACPSGQYRTAAGKCTPIPSCAPGQTFNASLGICQVVEVHDHTVRWVPGHPIIPSEWSSVRQYSGPCTLNDLAPDDAQAFTAMVAKAQTVSAPQEVRDRVTRGVQNGLVAFRKFKGADGIELGAFFSIAKSKLTIAVLPAALRTPHHDNSLWDQVVNAADGAINTVGDAVSDAANATGQFLSDLWDSIDEQVIAVYEAVKKYGCAIVGSDLVVALAATGAGIVATPATSAAIVSGAAAGRGACAALEVGELIIKILQLLSQDFPVPPPLAPGGTQYIPVAEILGMRRPPSGQLILGAPFTYPKGSFARFNTDTRMWSVYAPVTALGDAGGPGAGPRVDPPVPEGFVKVAEIIAPPPDVASAGIERNATVLTSPWLWAGVGATVLGAGLFVRHRRHSK